MGDFLELNFFILAFSLSRTLILYWIVGYFNTY